MLKRALSFLIAVMAVVAGVGGLGYTLEGIHDMKFFKDNLVGGALGILVPGVLSASAFYMAVRFFKSCRTNGNAP